MLPELDEIQKRRMKLGLRQMELARLAGVSQSLIAKVEGRKIDPAYSKIKAIFDLLENLERSEEIRAADIMCSGVVGVSKNDKVGKAVGLMKERNVSQLPVFENESVVGSISEQTLLNKFAKGDDISKLSESRVENLMDEAYPVIDKDSPISTIYALLRHSQAVIVGSRGKVVGIITKADLLKIVRR